MNRNIPHYVSMADIRRQAEILSLEEELIDATTEEGKQRIKEMEREAAAAKTETQETQTQKTETYDDPE